jgi:hypothetical protein
MSSKNVVAVVTIIAGVFLGSAMAVASVGTVTTTMPVHKEHAAGKSAAADSSQKGVQVAICRFACH